MEHEPTRIESENQELVAAAALYSDFRVEINGSALSLLVKHCPPETRMPTEVAEFLCNEFGMVCRMANGSPVGRGTIIRTMGNAVRKYDAKHVEKAKAES